MYPSRASAQRLAIQEDGTWGEVLQQDMTDMRIAVQLLWLMLCWQSTCL